jgi:putative transposase
MLKAYKYRIYPDVDQLNFFHKQFGTCRFVYNWALESRKKAYEDNKTSISKHTLKTMLPSLKKENEWLRETNSQSLQSAIDNLDNAYQRFFKGLAEYPNFKSSRNPIQSFQIPQHYTVDFEHNTIKFPKIKTPVKAKFHRKFTGIMKTATVSKTPTGKYFISILVDDGTPVPEKETYDNNSTVGLDLGIKDFAILSNGTKINNPKHLRDSMERLKALQKRVSRKKKGSRNRKKAAMKLAKLHEKIYNQRHDFQHKLTSRLIDENQAIAIENLNVDGMLKNHCLAQSISDVSWSSFITKLKYKANWYGKTVLELGRFEPSSKLCNVCGYKNTELKLSDRNWICPSCQTKHDRDINAAINIKNIALNTPLEQRIEPVDLFPIGKGTKQEASSSN